MKRFAVLVLGTLCAQSCRRVSTAAADDSYGPWQPTEQQIAHPAGGDSCTALYVSETTLASLWGCELGLPEEPLPNDARTDLSHRLLVAAVARGDVSEAVEAVVSLAADVLEQVARERVAVGRPATAQARRRAVTATREALAETPTACSPSLPVGSLCRRIT